MADRVVESSETEVPAIPELLEKVALFVLEEAKEKMTQGADVVPFTALIVKDNLFLESHPGDSTEECFEAANATVRGARGADAYAFCYDGFIDIDTGEQDALIAEGGIPGEPNGMSIGYLYKMIDGKPVFEEEPAYIGEAPNFMADLKESDAYDEEDIDEKYLAEDVVDEYEEDEE